MMKMDEFIEGGFFGFILAFLLTCFVFPSVITSCQETVDAEKHCRDIPNRIEFNQCVEDFKK